MSEENETSNQENVNTKKTDSSINHNEYILFLIFILLLMGNQRPFDVYCDQLKNQVNNITNFFEAFSSAANGISETIEVSQKVMSNINI